MPFARTTLSGVPLTRDNFVQPPKEMGILPFWFWNGAMDEKEMEWQLREYKSKGIPGVFIHGRFGLKVPYVSDAWFEKVRVAVERAKEIGIDTWVYDEMNWPSGTAERKVPTQYPHLRQKYLELVALNVDGPLFTFLEATDNRYVNTGDAYPIAAFGCTEEEFQSEIRNPIDLTQNLSFERVIPWEAPPGKWRLLYFLEKEVPYYIDALNPESTDRFIEFTHERYRAAVGKSFGTIVPGFYTDEPAMHYYHVGIDNFVIPWTGRMFKIFRERRGYDLRPFLPALYANMGPRTARIRYDFWRTLTEQYAETYYKRLHDWCEEHGVLFTGHLLFEEWLRLHARCEGNLFKYLEHMHLIGVDHLYPKVGTAQEPDQHVALKIASSAAHHFGSTRLLCESMGGAYWDCTLQRMKWIANWEYVLGVNLFNNHGYHYSIEGERKRDWPPSQFYHHPWWKYYGEFTTYMARLSHLLSGGRHVAKVLVLYPLTSIWAHYVPQKRDAIGNVIEADFNWLTDTLLRMHYDFDFVEEDVLSSASIERGTIGIRDERFQVLILPPVTHLKKTTFDAIRKFVKSGGTVIADALLPYEFMETDHSDAGNDVKALFGIDPRRLLREFEGASISKTTAIRKGKNVIFLKGKGLHASAGRRPLQAALAGALSPDVKVSDEEIFYLHRVKDDFDIYFFANTTQSARPGVAISLEQEGEPELWDLNTGAILPLMTYDTVAGRTAFVLDFPPAEARIIAMQRGAARRVHVTDTNLRVESIDRGSVSGTLASRDNVVHAALAEGGRTKRLTMKARRPLGALRFPETMEFRAEGDNALLLEKWKMQVGGDDRCAAKDFSDEGWLDVTRGAWEMQLGQERDEATYPVTLWYRTRFTAAFVPRNLRVLVDGFSGKEHALFVNGTRVKDPGRRSSLDAEIKEVDIAQHVSVGVNTIAIRLVVVRRTDGILDPLKLVGAFALREAEGDMVVIAPSPSIGIGDWGSQGYPFFSGTGIYRASIEIPAKYLDGRLALRADCGEDVLEIRVNDDKSFVAPWAPYDIDITGALRAGTNTVELRVTNTLINLLEGVRKPSGLFSIPELHHEHRYTLSLAGTSRDE
ncbi:MAG TPA: glycosyl hydrolase [Bacteroidota bacterium]|nr:glycosyl hydrolase [Bacteroidota bacterium]